MIEPAAKEPPRPPLRPVVAEPLPEVRFHLLQHIILPSLILLIGMAGLYGSSLLKKDPPRKEVPEFIPVVETVKVVPLEGTITLDVDGSVVPFREISIASEVTGRIKSKNPKFRAGNFVKKGTLLFEIDPIDFELEVKRLQQEVQQANSSLRELEVQLQNYQQLIRLAAEDRELQLREVARLRKLVSNRTVTESELDQALGAEVVKRNAVQLLTNQVKVLVPRRASQQASLALAKTRLEKAELDLLRTRITSPVDGVIVSDLFEENSFVSRGTTLTMLEETTAVEVRCNLRTDQLFWLWEHRDIQTDPSTQYEIPPAKAMVVFRIGQREYEWDGVLSRYEGTGLDERTRTIACRVLVENPTQGRLRNGSPGLRDAVEPPALARGMFVNVELETNAASRLLKVPIEAQKLGGTVWKVDGRQLRIAPIQIAKTERDYVLVDAEGSGIDPGDQLIITPIAQVEDGMEIQLSSDTTATAEVRPLTDDASPVAETSVNNDAYEIEL